MTENTAQQNKSELLKRLMAHIPAPTSIVPKVKKASPVKNTSQPLKGHTVVFTGGLKGMVREVAEEMATKLGAKKINSQFSGSCTCLIAGDDAKGNSKLVKAKKNGIKIVEQKEWDKMIKDAGL